MPRRLMLAQYGHCAGVRGPVGARGTPVRGSGLESEVEHLAARLHH
jgi:hypothetical protein